MQRNKYLEDLDLKQSEYDPDFQIDKKDKRQKKWKKQRKKYGFDERETWGLNDLFIGWLYSHLKMYEECASKIINLDFHKITYDGVEYTQKEVLDVILESCEEYLLVRNDWNKEKKARENLTKALHLWAEVFPAFWC